MKRAAVLAVTFATACAGRHRSAPEPPEDPPVAELQPTDETRAIDTRTEAMKREAQRTPPPGKPAKEAIVTTADAKPDIYADPSVVELIARIDIHEYERWPLSHNQHPALEPAYAIANVFASPGVSWLDLCRMGAQNRRGGGSKDQLEYLRAWCEVAKRDAGAAVARLRPLVNSSVLGMPAAVRTDIANIVVDAGDAGHAQRLMSRAQVDDLAVYDRAAAGYIEVGKVQDAIELTDRAIAAHDARRPQDHCMRIARKAAIVSAEARTPLILGLGTLKHCGTQYRELLCWHRKKCDPYLIAHGIDPNALPLGAIYKTWPQPGAPTEEWLRVARDAGASYKAGRQEAALLAIEIGLRSIGCNGPQVAELIAIARRMASEIRDPWTPEWDLRERFLAITATPDVVCAPN